MFFEVLGSALASVSAAAFMMLCAATAIAVAGAFGTVVVGALPFELANGGFTRMSVFVTLLMSAGVFTLVDFYLDFDGLQPAFEEAQQQAAAAEVTMPQRRRLHHGWTWVTPLRRQASISRRTFKEQRYGVNACDYAVVRNCAVCVLWAQLKGDSLQALLNTLGVEVDDHPVFLEDDAIAKCPRLPSLRRRLISRPLPCARKIILN